MDDGIAAGVDVGKSRLDVAVCGLSGGFEVANTPEGHGALVDRLRGHGVGRIGLEASGGYERGVCEALRAAGFEVVVLQPAQVRAYAAFKLQRAKNDRIDARLIAACTAQAACRPAHDVRIAALAEHLTFIEQIEEDLVRAKTRLEGFRELRQCDRLKAEIVRLRALRRVELAALTTALRAFDDLARNFDLAVSVPGVGPRTALALIIRMPELGTISREQAASLAGLAPFDRDSGKLHGARHIQGGRARLRTSLYAAALPAAFRWNPALVSLYQRLTASGKPHKLALVACARKLLIFVNTVIQRQAPWVTQTTKT